MTLCNWHVGRDSATVVTDSLCTQAGLPACWQPKAFIIWHATMVLVSRGPMDIGWLAMWDLAHRHYEGGIDGAEKILPSLLADAQDEIVERHRGATTSLASEVGLVGYSPTAGGYRAIRFESKHGFAPDPQPQGVYLSPGPPGYRPSRLEPPSDAQWLASAREQQRVLARERAPEWGSVGGPLFCIELTKAGITIRKLGTLPMYEEAREEMRKREGLPRVPSPISRLVDA